jgi:hypothetical protein
MILKKVVSVCLCAGLPGFVCASPDRATPGARSARSCDPALAALFAPRHPQLGRYEVCQDPRGIEDATPAGWAIEREHPLDAFGASPIDRSKLVRLYGGRQARVARGWTRTSDGFESVTLISPHPARDFTRLEPGTLVIRWISGPGL